jgi:hypothetical protein
MYIGRYFSFGPVPYAHGRSCRSRKRVPRGNLCRPGRVEGKTCRRVVHTTIDMNKHYWFSLQDLFIGVGPVIKDVEHTK